jgi:hypothetical protein
VVRVVSEGSNRPLDYRIKLGGGQAYDRSTE